MSLKGLGHGAYSRLTNVYGSQQGHMDLNKDNNSRDQVPGRYVWQFSARCMDQLDAWSRNDGLKS